jgi:PAS domain S-box-containing protein
VPAQGRSAAPDLDPIRAFADASPIAAMLLSGASHHILHVNPPGLRAIGRPAEELLGRAAAEVFPDLAAAGQLAALDAVRASGIGRSNPGRPLRLGPEPEPRFWDVDLTPLGAAEGRMAWGILAQLRDVTAQQQALRRGEAARATLDALFDHIPEGLMLAEGPELRVTRVSAHGLGLAGGGAAAGQGLAAELWTVLRPEDAQPVPPEETPLARAVREGRTVQHETWLLPRPSGPPLPILCSAGPIRDEAGLVTGGILVWRDITDLRRAEAALAASEARYRALVKAGALAVWTTRPDGTLHPAADWMSLTGQTAREAAGWGWLDALHPEDRERVRELWAGALARQAIYEAEYRLHRPGDGWRWTAARAVPLRDAAGRVTEWVGINTDIDSRKRAEQALRVSEDRFRTLSEAMPHMVWQTDAHGVPDYMNGRMQGYTGLDLARARSGGWLAILHPEDAASLVRAWDEALASGTDYTADARLRGVEGGFRWFQVKAAPVRDTEGTIRHWVGTCTDMEERHRAEEALREALAAREGLVREADHRIKNSLQLVAALLRLQAGRMEEPAVRLALEAATVRVTAVAEAHRALQKSPDLRNIRLADMLRELASGVAVQHPGADMRAQAPESLMLDAERAIPLALVLTELVANILRAPQDGSAGAVRLEARVEGGMLVMEVADAGPPGAAPAGPEGATAAARLGGTVIRALARQIGARLAQHGRSTILSLKLEPGEATSAAPNGQ